MNVKTLVLLDDEPIALFADPVDGDNFAKRKAEKIHRLWPRSTVTLCEEMNPREVMCTRLRGVRIECSGTVRTSLNAILSKRKKFPEAQGG